VPLLPIAPPSPLAGGFAGERSAPLRVRWVAVLGLRLAPALPARGALSLLHTPAHPVPSPCSPPAAARLPCAARGARAPSAPRGAQEAGKNPSPAKRNPSLAAGRAYAVKAKPAATLRVALRASLDRAHPAAGHVPATWPENRAGTAGWLGGAPAGRGVVAPSNFSCLASSGPHSLVLGTP